MTWNLLKNIKNLKMRTAAKVIMKVFTLLYWPQLYFSTANKSSLNKLAVIAVVQNVSVVQHNR